MQHEFIDYFAGAFTGELNCISALSSWSFLHDEMSERAYIQAPEHPGEEPEPPDHPAGKLP